MKKMGVIAAVALVSGALWATDLTLSTREATVNVDGEYTLEQVTETGYSHLRFKMKEPFQPAKILSFEYRLDNPADFMYVATNLTSDTQKSTYNAFPPSAEWKKAELYFENLAYTKSKGLPEEGENFVGLTIYCRRQDKAPKGPVRLQVRNIKIETNADYNPADNCKLYTSGVEKKGNTYTLDQKKNERFGNIFFLVKENYDPAKHLVFEYRVKNPAQFNYVAVSFRGLEGVGTFNGYPAKEEWTKVDLPFSKLKNTKWVETENGKQRMQLKPEHFLNRLQIYARIDDKNAAAPIFFELRNVRITTPEKAESAK